MSRIALVTGANQGLGFALAEGLARRMDPGDTVHLTGRDRGRVEAAAARIEGARAEVRPGVLDVRDPDAIAAFAAQLGAIDVLFANATARMTPERTWAGQIDAQVETSNYATTAILRAFHPRLRPGGRLLVVASSLGRLSQLPPELHDRFRDDLSLDELDSVVTHWAALVRAGREGEERWPEWINVPSKVAQVAAVRILARERREHGAPDGSLVAAVCPGLLDTEASRPWFADMSAARTPAEGAEPLLALALEPFDPTFDGELVRDGAVLPWR
jgi:carbonyl reductase 1